MTLERLRAQVSERDWYHTLELAPGVVTPGWFDTRGVVGELPLPASLAGKRCLDVGTFDGFWAFELERRGAREVVAIDLLDHSRADWPPNARPETVAAISGHKRGGGGFELASESLGSSVVRHELSVYDVILIRKHRYVYFEKAFESFGLDGDLVQTGKDTRKFVGPCRGGGEGSRDTGALIGDDDLSLRNGSAGGIEDLASKSTGYRLRKSYASREKKQ